MFTINSPTLNRKAIVNQRKLAATGVNAESIVVIVIENPVIFRGP